jgi:hypothetical protein
VGGVVSGDMVGRRKEREEEKGEVRTRWSVASPSKECRKSLDPKVPVEFMRTTTICVG